MAMIKCPECNFKISDQSLSCPKCGRPLNNMNNAFGRFPSPNSETYNNSIIISSKSRLAAALLCFFFGFLGVHRFYVGKNISGVIMILTFVISLFLSLIPITIWCIIDFIIILCGSFTDSHGLALKEWT